MEQTLLKKTREEKNITLRKMAADTGLHNPYLSMLENRRIKNPSIETVSKICAYLEIEISAAIEDLLKSKPINAE